MFVKINCENCISKNSSFYFTKELFFEENSLKFLLKVQGAMVFIFYIKLKRYADMIKDNPKIIS
jgi:hypothetical protein